MLLEERAFLHLENLPGGNSYSALSPPTAVSFNKYSLCAAMRPAFFQLRGIYQRPGGWLCGTDILVADAEGRYRQCP